MAIYPTRNMGCTSSTPNMVTANANPTDKIIHFSEDTKNDKHSDEISNSANGENETIEKVLPACDTLDESIQLVRNNKSIIDTSRVESDKVSDAYTNGYVADADNALAYKEDSQVEEKLSSLEDVVEKVVELHIADADIANAENIIDNTKIVPVSSTELTKNEDQSRGEKNEEIFEETSEPHVGTEPSKLIEEKLEEAISPSQSTSSRATRWEALADIAAELPPSLAVDPVSGQIYALSK